MSFDQRFWLRLATRSDAATDDEQRKQLSDLAKVGRGACELTVVCEPQAAGTSCSWLQDVCPIQPQHASLPHCHA